MVAAAQSFEDLDQSFVEVPFHIMDDQLEELYQNFKVVDLFVANHTVQAASRNHHASEVHCVENSIEDLFQSFGVVLLLETAAYFSPMSHLRRVDTLALSLEVYAILGKQHHESLIRLAKTVVKEMHAQGRRFTWGCAS